MSARIEKGRLKKGLKVGETHHKDFEMSPIETMAQMFQAETEADPSQPLRFRAALMCQQLKRVGEFTGPFLVDMIATLSPQDFGILRQAQSRLDGETSEDGELGKPDASA